MDTFEILSQLCSAAGVSGAEGSAAEAAAKLLKSMAKSPWITLLAVLSARLEAGRTASLLCFLTPI